jgi:signal peptide peptidase SppA
MHTEKCLSRHLGVWAMTEYCLERWPLWFGALHAVRNGHALPDIQARARGQASEEPLYEVVNGVAIIPVSGPMMKGDSKYGGANTVQIRRSIRAAVGDDAVRAILLGVDSPGGTVAGTDELARDIKRADLVKPVHAHIDDLGASAAYWIASQARKVTAGYAAEVGSIGVYAVVEDSSAAAAAQGVKVHVVSTGPMKGALEPGTPVTESQLAYVQERVDEMNQHFKSAILRGRAGITHEQLAQASDGRVFGAKEAKALGLIDKVQSFDEAIESMAPRRKFAVAASLARFKAGRYITR